MGGKPALQRVELVEDDALDESPAPRSRPRGERRTQPRHAGARRRRRALLAGAGVVAVLAFVLIGAQALLDAAYRDRVEARAHLPGAIDPVGQQAQVRWSTDAAVMDALLMDTPVDGAYVGMRTLPGGVVEALALDAATGAARWSRTLRAGPRQDAAVALGGNACTVSVLPDERDALVCVLTYQPRDERRRPEGARAELVVLDAATGEPVARRATAAQAGRVVVSRRTAVVAWRVLGRVHVHAQDLLTGRALWDAAFSVPRTGSPSLSSLRAGSRIPRVQLVAGPGGFAVGAGQQVYLLDARGRVRPHGRIDGYVRDGRADRVVVLTLDDGPGTLVVRPGRTPAAVPGVVALPSLDDGSLSDVVLTVDTGLRRVEPRSGRPLWTLEGRDSGTVVLDGVVYQSGEAAVLRAVDGHSGAVLWSTPATRAAYVTDLVTDGRRLYVALQGLVGADTFWLTYGLDGTPLGRLYPPVGWRGPEVRGRALVAISTDGMRAAVLG